MESDFAVVRRRFVSSMVTAMGSSPEVLERLGTTVVADPNRSPDTVACYQIGHHTIIPCGSAVSSVAELRAAVEQLATGEQALDHAAFRSWATEHGASIVGQAVMKTRSAPMGRPATLPGQRHVFDWNEPDDLDRISAFVGTCDPDDLDEAELDLDQLDGLAVGLLDQRGTPAAYASSRPFEEDPSFGDIGVIVRPGQRNGGWGGAVVQTLIETVLLPLGIEPLYRCDTGNSASDRLSAGLGFTPALSLTVVRFPALGGPAG